MAEYQEQVVTFRIRADELKVVRQIARRTERNTSQVIRLALRELIAREGTSPR